jgi:hypothetical protein
MHTQVTNKTRALENVEGFSPRVLITGIKGAVQLARILIDTQLQVS